MAVRGRAPANLNKEGRRVGGRKEVRGEGRHDWAPLQCRHSLWWCGMGKKAFFFPHKEIISPSNCLPSLESQPNHLQLLQPEHVIYALQFLVIFMLCLFKYLLGNTYNFVKMFRRNCQMAFWHFICFLALRRSLYELNLCPKHVNF